MHSVLVLLVVSPGLSLHLGSRLQLRINHEYVLLAWPQTVSLRNRRCLCKYVSRVSRECGWDRRIRTHHRTALFACTVTGSPVKGATCQNVGIFTCISFVFFVWGFSGAVFGGKPFVLSRLVIEKPSDQSKGKN